VAQIGIGWASVSEIDAINIRNAAFLAMRRAVEALPIAPDHVLVDGNACPAGPALRGLAAGEGRCAERVDCGGLHRGQGRAGPRDGGARLATHPGYGWATNAGYPTQAHRDALQHLGVTPHHRRSFAPVYQMLCR
jgi:ribonuclease HII